MNHIRNRFAPYSTSFFRTKVLMAAGFAMVSALTPLFDGEPVALADSPATVSSVATTTLNLSKETSALSSTVSGVIRTAADGANWNTVLFGGVSPTSQQDAVVNQIAPMLKALIGFDSSNGSLATNEVTASLQAIQSLNPILSSSDVLSFLQSFEQDAFSNLYGLVESGQSSASSQVSDVLHAAFTSALSTAPADVAKAFSGTDIGAGTTTSTDVPPQVPGVPTQPQIPGSTLGGSTSTLPTGGSPMGGGSRGSLGLPISGMGGASPGAGTGAGSTSTGTPDSLTGTSSPSSQPGKSNTTSTTGKSGTPMGTFHIPGLDKTLKQVYVPSAGVSIPITVGKAQVQLTIPGSALPAGTNVNVTTADLDNGIAAAAPAGYRVSAAVGVEFSDATPKLPIRLQITDKSIESDSKVYKVTSSGLQPVVADVAAGKATVLFTTDPDFVIFTPVQAHSIGKSQRGIYLDGTQLSVVPAVIHGMTTYMPIWYVMSALSQLGIQSHWDGHQWSLTTSGTVSTNLSNLSAGQGSEFISVNGTKVQFLPGLTAKDPSTGKNTMFMPVWYVMRVLNRLGVKSKWDGTHWYLTVNS